ncbi:hypothetical protein AUK22_01345 [bacterium CG2_30_54_10]|nr:MAG: hypothetical protein AUK22_01345 [bacterium CG2_30_54_10]
MQVFSLFHSRIVGLTVDLFAYHPIPLDAIWSQSEIMDLNGVPVRVCSIDDLIELKRMAGRRQDLADIEELTKIKAIRRKKSGD